MNNNDTNKLNMGTNSNSGVTAGFPSENSNGL